MWRQRFGLTLFFLFLFTFIFISQALARAKYIFFFIGDGMAFPQRVAAEKFLGKTLLMDKLPAQGMTTTYAANRFITDSAAAGTALACGVKTNVGVIGLTPDGRKVKTIAEMAKERGMKVGIISTVSLDHATPASFYAHVPSRHLYYDIEIQLAKSGFDFFGGGGFKDPTNKKGNALHYEGNAIDVMKKYGYKIIRSKEEFLKLKKGDGKVIVINPRLDKYQAEPYTIDQNKNDITLAELTKKAIELLDNPKGFFIMVEGGKIDWACHANDAVTAIKDTIALDEAIKVAYQFYKKHPRETLIVVTGDHETGGMTLGFAGTKYQTYFNILKNQKMSYERFTNDIVKKWKEMGITSFDSVKPAITYNFGLKFSGNPKKDPLVLKPYEIERLKKAWADSLTGVNPHDYQSYLLYGGYEPLTVTITHILDNKAGIGWTSYKHTAVPVPTSAIGVDAQLFNGYYDNTDVAKKIMKAMGISPRPHYMGYTEYSFSAAE